MLQISSTALAAAADNVNHPSPLDDQATMLRSPPLLIALLTLCCGAQALRVRDAAPVPPDADAAWAEQARKQKLRDVVRDAVKLPVEDARPAGRQLSPQEKAELRQQLRQQRVDVPQ
jgi:hypothetical protein